MPKTAVPDTLQDSLKEVLRESGGRVGLAILAQSRGRLTAFWNGAEVELQGKQFPYPKLFTDITALRKKLQTLRLIWPIDDSKWVCDWFIPENYSPSLSLIEKMQQITKQLPGSLK